MKIGRNDPCHCGSVKPRFLASRQLLDAQQRIETLQGLQGLDTELLKLWEREGIDPALVQGMRRWQEDAGLA